MKHLNEGDLQLFEWLLTFQKRLYSNLVTLVTSNIASPVETPIKSIQLVQ